MAFTTKSKVVSFVILALLLGGAVVWITKSRNISYETIFYVQSCKLDRVIASKWDSDTRTLAVEEIRIVNGKPSRVSQVSKSDASTQVFMSQGRRRFTIEREWTEQSKSPYTLVEVIGNSKRSVGIIGDRDRICQPFYLSKNDSIVVVHGPEDLMRGDQPYLLDFLVVQMKNTAVPRDSSELKVSRLDAEQVLTEPTGCYSFDANCEYLSMVARNSDLVVCGFKDDRFCEIIRVDECLGPSTGTSMFAHCIAPGSNLVCIAYDGYRPSHEGPDAVVVNPLNGKSCVLLSGSLDAQGTSVAFGPKNLLALSNGGLIYLFELELGIDGTPVLTKTMTLPNENYRRITQLFFLDNSWLMALDPYRLESLYKLSWN